MKSLNFMQQVATPQTLINALAFANAPFSKTKWVFKWLVDNSTQSTVLDETLRKLDDKGKEMFGRTVAYHHGQSNDVLAYAQRTLTRRVANKHEEELCEYIEKHGKKAIILANGLRCVLAAEDKTYGWYAEVNCKGSLLRLQLWPNQMVILKEKAAKKISILKRMDPEYIQYLRNKRWIMLPKESNRLVMSAIADKIPLEIAAILKK